MSQVPFRELLVQRDQWDVLGAEKINFLIRVADGRSHHGGRRLESCRSVAQRSPWARLGSVLYTCNRLRRMRPGSGHNRPILSPLRLIKP